MGATRVFNASVAHQQRLRAGGWRLTSGSISCILPLLRTCPPIDLLRPGIGRHERAYQPIARSTNVMGHKTEQQCPASTDTRHQALAVGKPIKLDPSLRYLFITSIYRIIIRQQVAIPRASSRIECVPRCVRPGRTSACHRT